jgi:glycosyltransferase involved in cell wall biosynthesis
MNKTLIGMLTYNSGERLRKVLQDITAQTAQAWELHVFDDYSTDETISILQEFSSDARITLHLNNSNLGYISNLENAFSFLSNQITGFEFFWFAQHDDHYSQDYLSKAQSVLNENSELIGVQFQFTSWNCSQSIHILSIDSYLKHPKNLFHYNGKSKNAIEEHSIVGIIQGVAKASKFNQMYGVESNLVGSYFSFEILLVLNILLKGNFALLHGDDYVVSTGETIETLYPEDDYNKNRKSMIKTLKNHARISFEWSSQNDVPIASKLILNKIVLLNILHGERRFQVAKRLIRTLTGNRFSNIEREVRKLHKDNSILLRLFDNFRMKLGKNLFMHRIKYLFFRKFDGKVLHILLKTKYRNPRTFNEKLRYKLFNDERALLGIFTDKIEAKRFIANIFGWESLPKTYYHSSLVSDLNLQNLPRECVVKASHLSGGALIISCDAPRGLAISRSPFGRTLIHPDDLKEQDLNLFAEGILNIDYLTGAFSDKGYVGLPRRFIVEELIKGETIDESVFDIKIFVLNGVPRLIRKMQSSDFGQEEKFVNDFLPDGTRINSLFYEPGKIYNSGPIELSKLPVYISKLLEISKKFGEFTDFIRVDFLCTDEKYFIGELTNFPTGTRGGWNPNKVAQYLSHFYHPWDTYSE